MFWGLISICVMAAKQIAHDVRIERNDQKGRETPTWYGTFYSCDGHEKWASTMTPVSSTWRHGEHYLKDLKTNEVYNLDHVKFEMEKEELIKKAKLQNRTVVTYGRDRHNGYDQQNDVKGQRFYDIESGKLLVARNVYFDGVPYCAKYFCNLDGSIVRKTDIQKIDDNICFGRYSKDGKLKSGWYGTKYKKYCYINSEEEKKLIQKFNNDLDYRSKCDANVVNYAV